MFDETGNYEKGPRDYLGMFLRRKSLLILSALVIFAIGVVVAYKWPPVYRSTAIILIEEPEVPADLVQSTVTSYASQRIEVIKQRVTTSRNLTQLINRYGLYKDMREAYPMTRVIQQFRDDIGMEPISARVIDPRSGRAALATIAFRLWYDSQSPRLAQQVTNELVTSYLSENIRERQGQAAETTKFLGDESDRLAAQIRQLEASIARFKKKYEGALPEQLNLNMDVAERTERQISDLDGRLRRIAERQSFLTAQLTSMSNASSAAGSGDGGPAARLESLKAEYKRKIGVYGERHPDIIKMKEEIKALQGEVGSIRSVQRILNDLNSAQRRLDTLRAKRRSDDPAIKKAGAQVDRLTAEYDKARKKALERASAERAANPLFVELNAQLVSLETERREVIEARKGLVKKVEVYRARVAATPEIERQYLALKRDYDNAKAKYKETKDKFLAAQLSQALERERKGERFTLIEPPQEPQEPIRPKRAAIIGGSGAFGIAFAVGLVLLLGAFDERIYGGRQLTALVGEEPLASIPFITTRADRVRRVTRISLITLVILSIVGAAAWYVNTYVQPLDLYFIVKMREFGL